MKILLTFLILFSFSVVAEDISDFQIEGISIGDSLLDYVTEEKIKEELFHFPNDIDKTFIHAEFYKPHFIEQYVSIQFAMKTNDTRYIIYGIRAGIFFDNIDDCYNKMNNVAENISRLFQNSERVDQEDEIHPIDKSGKSTSRGIAFFLKSGVSSVRCFDWSENMPYDDNMAVTIKTNEYNHWLSL